MKVLVDFTQIPIQKVGVGVYAVETFNRLFQADLLNEYYILIQDDDIDFGSIHGKNVRKIRINAKWFRIFLFRFLMEQLYIPYLVKKLNIDKVHSLHYSYPFLIPSYKRIITIHDLTFFIYPNLHTLFKRHYFRFFIKCAAKSKSSLICVSESTKNDLFRIIAGIKAKVYVVPLACSIPELQDSQYIECKRKYGLPNEYMLFIGTLEPRKNIDGLIRACVKLRNTINCQLVVIGKKGWFYDKIFSLIYEFNMSDFIIFTGFVTEEEKYLILKNAKLFIYPSFYEGFGLPVLESISLGIPTITSNISSMPEVVADGGLLIDPSDVDSISRSIIELLTHDDLRSLLVRRGILQSKQFSWEKTAMNTLSIYKNSNTIS